MRKAIIALAALVPLATLVLATTATGSAARPAAATAVPGCATASLNLVNEGELTVGTDNPAFPPWFGGTQKGSWKVSDPTSGKGYESAFAYAVARQLGFTRDQVKWVYVPFLRAIAPGKKSFDFDVNQISYSAQRAKVATFSSSYYDVRQGVVVRKGTPIASVRGVAGLRKYKLGAQIGTTSYRYIVDHIKPDRQPSAFPQNIGAINALKNGQIDGLVVDVPTGFIVTAVQVPNSKVLGQLPRVPGGEHFGALFQKGNPLVGCVNKAIARLRANGTIRTLERVWLRKATGAPELK
jgi:polar amino acid transport system substrate-binding protein